MENKIIEKRVQQKILDGSRIIGGILKNARKSKNLSILKVTQKINLEPEKISKWEKGLELPSFRATRLMLELYGKDPSEADAAFFRITQAATDEFQEITNSVFRNHPKEPL